jgi:hypothetical protein
LPISFFRGKKNEIVRAAYEQREALENNGSISIPLANPKLFNINVKKLFKKRGDGGEATSEEFDSDFAAAIPRLIMRRNALLEEDVEQIRDRVKNSTWLNSDAVSVTSTASAVSRFNSGRFSVRMHTSEEEDLMERLGKETGKRRRRVRKIPGLGK